MNNREHLIRGGVCSQHIVHFFDDDAARVNAVGAFLADGLKAGKSVIAIVRPKYWTDIAELLQAQSVVVHADARLIVLDAHATLAGLMRHGQFEPSNFRKTVTPLVKSVAVASGAGMAAYGEMVDILASEGNFAAAEELEAAWNELAAETSMSLLCGYSSAHFSARGQRDALAAICRAHTDVRTDAVDALGSWLLRRAIS